MEKYMEILEVSGCTYNLLNFDTIVTFEDRCQKNQDTEAVDT